MNHIREHLPSHFDGFDLRTAAFTSLDELSAVSFVAPWTKSSDFLRFCAKGYGDRDTAMLFAVVRDARYIDGENSWPIGVMSHDIPEISRFRRPRKAVEWMPLACGMPPPDISRSTMVANVSQAVLITTGGREDCEGDPGVILARWRFDISRWVSRDHMTLGCLVEATPTYFAYQGLD